MKHTLTVLLTTLLLLAPASAGQLEDALRIYCGNLVYGKNQTSVCFADKFLQEAVQSTNLDVDLRFKRLKLSDDEVFDTPFCVFTGEGNFSLSQKERDNLLAYLSRGGFIVACPGCSDSDWSRAFRSEIAALFPTTPLKKIPMTHTIFNTVFEIPRLTLKKSSGTTLLEGIEVDGRLALVFSPDGLNDARNAKGCCCCGGNEIRESVQMNINLLTYALLY